MGGWRGVARVVIAFEGGEMGRKRIRTEGCSGDVVPAGW